MALRYERGDYGSKAAVIKDPNLAKTIKSSPVRVVHDEPRGAPLGRADARISVARPGRPASYREPPMLEDLPELTSPDFDPD